MRVHAALASWDPLSPASFLVASRRTWLLIYLSSVVPIALLAAQDTRGSRVQPSSFVDFPLRSCNRTPSGSGAPPQRARWLHRLPPHIHDAKDIRRYVEEWEVIQGFIAPESVFFMHLVTSLQHEFGVLGAVGEIGIAAGLSIMGMALARRGNESVVAIDLFDALDFSAGDGGEMGDRRNAGDPLGGQRLAMFGENLDVIGLDLPGGASMSRRSGRVSVHQGSSMELSDEDLLKLSGGNGFRMFHVDGAHFARAAFHDLCVVSCTLVRGGILLLDDVFSTGWLGVGEGFHRFMHSQGWLRENELAHLSLEPFLYAGRLYMAERQYAALYREHLRSLLPVSGGKSLMAVKMLYDSEVLFPKDFELVMSQSTTTTGMPLARAESGEILADDEEQQYVLKKRKSRRHWGEAMLALRRLSIPVVAGVM